jgi:hypothetical protein
MVQDNEPNETHKRRFLDLPKEDWVLFVLFFIAAYAISTNKTLGDWMLWVLNTSLVIIAVIGMVSVFLWIFLPRKTNHDT